MSYKAAVAQLMRYEPCISAHCAPTDARSPRVQADWRDEWRNANGQPVSDNYCAYPVSDPRMKIKVTPTEATL